MPRKVSSPLVPMIAGLSLTIRITLSTSRSEPDTRHEEGDDQEEDRVKC